MRKIGFAIAVVLALIVPSTAHAQDRWTPPLSYAAFMRQDHEGRMRTFNRLSTENKAYLVGEQIARWMEVNRSYLTSAQQRVLTDFLNIMWPPTFRLPGDRDTVAWREALAARAEKLFLPAQIRQAFKIIEADYIPLPQPLPAR